MNDANRRTALVSGASRGIGAAIADALGRSCFVVGTATTQTGAEAIAERLGDRGMGIVMKVDDDGSVAAAFEQLGERDLMPLVLVNNAGITSDNLLMRMKVEEWTRVIDTNLNGLYRVVKPVLRGMMKARWGRIINVSSVVARMGNPGQSNYVASKSGVEGFTRSLAQEVGSRGITVNAVAPGFIATDMTATLDAAQVEMMSSRIPLGTLGKVEDVAHAVAFLASDQAGYITGETLHVNGGLYMA
ncbi:MAG: 3-oxoacyl-ACP reductase FabG [Pseudomonadales bacterium]